MELTDSEFQIYENGIICLDDMPEDEYEVFASILELQADRYYIKPNDSS